jgi:hypothetical protein
MRLTLSLLLLITNLFLANSPASAQYHAVKWFVPSGYTILGRAAADINGDGHTDVVMVLRNPYEKLNADTARQLLLLAGNGKGGYHLLARNDSVVLCLGCGGVHGDPFEQVTAGNRWFSVQHFGGSGWRWTRAISFRYDDHRQQFILRSDGGYNWYISSPDKRTHFTNRPQDFGKVAFGEFSYNRAFESK